MNKHTWLVWLPVIGCIVMLFFTEFGRYRRLYFAGEFWDLYQMICFGFSCMFLIQRCL